MFIAIKRFIKSHDYYICIVIKYFINDIIDLLKNLCIFILGINGYKEKN